MGEKAPVSAAEYTRLMLPEGRMGPGCLCGQPIKPPMTCTQDRFLTRLTPLREGGVTEKLTFVTIVTCKNSKSCNYEENEL